MAHLGNQVDQEMQNAAKQAREIIESAPMRFQYYLEQEMANVDMGFEDFFGYSELPSRSPKLINGLPDYMIESENE